MVLEPLSLRNNQIWPKSPAATGFGRFGIAPTVLLITY